MCRFSPSWRVCSVVSVFRIVLLLYFNILNFLFVLFCEIKVIMLLKVQVQPICTFWDNICVTFAGYGSTCNCYILFCFSLLGKVKMFHALRSDPFHYFVFLSLKAKIKAQLSINSYKLIMGLWVCNVICCKHLLCKREVASNISIVVTVSLATFGIVKHRSLWTWIQASVLKSISGNVLSSDLLTIWYIMNYRTSINWSALADPSERIHVAITSITDDSSTRGCFSLLTLVFLAWEEMHRRAWHVCSDSCTVRVLLCSLKREEAGWLSVATTVRYDDCCIIRLLIFLFWKYIWVLITSVEAVTFKVVNFMSCSTMEAETELP